MSKEESRYCVGCTGKRFEGISPLRWGRDRGRAGSKHTGLEKIENAESRLGSTGEEVKHVQPIPSNLNKYRLLINHIKKL